MSSQYLAEIQMPLKDDIIIEEDGRSDYNYSDEEDQIQERLLASSEGVEEEQVSLPPPPEKKVKLKKEDIFKSKAPPQKKLKTETPTSVMDDEPIVPTITPIKKKRVMSDKQKEALKKGREARSLKAKNNAPAEREAPASRRAPAPAPAPVPSEVPSKQHYYSKEDLEQMVYKGVEQYDTQRKARKAKKRKDEAKSSHDTKVFSEINSALGVTNSDPWANCFN